jgi:hypothetical protein
MRPKYQQQGPDTNCKVTKNGTTYLLGWDSCTAYSAAMAQDSTTGGRQQPSGCAVRRATNDVSGGTTVPQVSDALFNLYGTNILRYTGSSVITPQRLAAYIRAGRKAIAQGNADALIGTTFRSTGGSVNHCVYINEVRGGTVSEPHEALVYDPAADGRHAGWGTADQGPSWWPWSLVKKFCANLQPGNPINMARLGPGKVYCGIFPDSEPHLFLVSGGRKASPFPDRTRAAEPVVWVHTNRKKGTASRKYSVKSGTLLVLWQYAIGDVHEGSNLWGGNDDGTEWVHLKNLSHVGGNT